MVLPQYVFVCGCPRSGTTLFANLLNAHPQIAIGIERYGNRFFKEPLTPDLFTPERFFDLRAGDTFYASLDFAQVYAEKRETFARAERVGDKIPLLFDRFAQLHAHFPDAKVVFCLRNIIDVAASYEVRARNPDDATWKREKGMAAAVEDWKRSLEAFHAYRTKIDIALFDYDRFAGDGMAQLKQLVGWLGLDWCDKIQRRVAQSRERATKIAGERQHPLDGRMKKQLTMTAPFPLYRQAIRLGSQTIARPAPSEAPAPADA